MDNNKFDKKTIMEAFEEAINNVKNDEEFFGDQADEVNSDEVNSDEVNSDSEEMTNEESKADDVDVDVKEAVDEEVEKTVNDLSGSFKFLDIDIDIKENDEESGYNITLKKDDKSEEYPSDDISLQRIFDLIDSFLQNLVIEEASDEESDEEESKEDKEESDKSDEKDEKEEEDKEPVQENSIVADELLANLRVKYADRVNKIFNHGLEATNIALDMVKNEILANSVKELLAKSESKDKEILACKQELNDASKNYLLARNMNDNFTKFYNTLVANVKIVEDNLSKNIISKNIADKTLDRYKTIVSKIIEAKQSKTVLAGIQQLENTHKTLLAHIDRVNEKTKAVLASKKQFNKENVSKEETTVRKPMISKRVITTVVAGNKLNDGMIGRQSLSQAHRRYNAVDEMTAEIVRIMNGDSEDY